MTTEHGGFCGWLTAMLILAAGFAIVTSLSFPVEQRERDSYWKTKCTVTDCNDAYPHYSVVTFQSHEPYIHNLTKTIKNGCNVHPIGSLKTCYVNAFGLKMEPAGVYGTVMLSFASLFAIIAVMIIIGWITSCAYECRMGMSAQSNFPSATTPSSNTTSAAITTKQDGSPLILTTQSPPLLTAPALPLNPSNVGAGSVQVFDYDDDDFEHYNNVLHSVQLGTLSKGNDDSPHVFHE